MDKDKVVEEMVEEMVWMMRGIRYICTRNQSLSSDTFCELRRSSKGCFTNPVDSSSLVFLSLWKKVNPTTNEIYRSRESVPTLMTSLRGAFYCFADFGN